MARQRPTRLVMGPCIVEIDRIDIREVQYQFEVNRCTNEEIIVKGNFGWVWSIWVERPRIDRIVIRGVQYQFEVNPCRNEKFQGSSANSNGRTDGRTDEDKYNIPTFSPKNVEITTHSRIRLEHDKIRYKLLPSIRRCKAPSSFGKVVVGKTNKNISTGISSSKNVTAPASTRIHDNQTEKADTFF
ncbi:hypothetical protein DPMN_141965 [Dreissena polymorpha]|uniref:Uncharacterized protein n=1 Tax=Dreissena polymorpha TaxID=45954 RepID=A0A9D4GAE3_DREPO|nr:hypothetical protein DPMN_141965 [Dreissena polymorpha]